MFANSDELLKFVKDEGVEMIDVRFCDLPGIMQHFTVPVSSFDQAVFDDGLNFDGSSIRGFQAINESDMALFPDPTTAYLDPFRTSKTLWSKEEAGTVKCCITPGRSQNRTSIISTPSSLMNFRSSSELLNIRFLLDGGARTSSLQRSGAEPRCTVPPR